jgi:hypothetical protein
MSNKQTSVLVQDAVSHPTDIQRFHYRVEAVVPMQDAVDKNAQRFVHIDMDAHMHDTTVRIQNAQCAIDEVAGEGVITISDVGEEQTAKLGEASVILAQCDDDTVVIATLTQRAKFNEDGSVELRVNTNFLSEMDKIHKAFKHFEMQTYAGPAPIEEAQHLEYLKTSNTDPNAFYSKLSNEYGRSDRTTVRARKLQDTQSLEGSTDATDIYNCDTVSTDQNNRGCATFTSDSITLIDGVVLEYGSATLEASLYCKECAATLEGASVYGTLTTDSSFTSASAEFDFKADMTGLVIDYSLLLELAISVDTSSDPAPVTLFDIFVPRLGEQFDLFGIDLGLGLKTVGKVTPNVVLDADLTVESGAKIVMDGSFEVAGSCDLSSLTMDPSSGSFTTDNTMETPKITATVEGTFELDFELELQVGLWAGLDAGGGDASASASAEMYGAIGVPLYIDGSVAATNDGLLSSIPDSYCVTDYDPSMEFFVGDCSQSNNLQVQISVGTEDLYGKVVANAAVEVAGVTLGGFDFEAQIDQSELTGFSLAVGPYSITYCDCILWDGTTEEQCTSASESQCENFPPAEDRVAPAYNEDSPDSGMALAWEQDAPGSVTSSASSGSFAGVPTTAMLILAVVSFLSAFKRQ